jgi:hypothetical protein
VGQVGDLPHTGAARTERQLTVSQPPSHSLTAAPAAGRLRQRLWVLGLATAALVACAAWATWSAWSAHRETGPVRPDDLILCWRFAALKNAHEPVADRLLAPPPTATEAPVTPEEAERLDADAFLRRDLRVVDVRPDDTAGGARRFVLVTKGAAAGEPLRVRSGDKIERTQRVMTNPEIVVEVRDGKLDGVRVQLGMD